MKNTGNVVLGKIEGSVKNSDNKTSRYSFTDGTDTLQPGEEKVIKVEGKFTEETQVSVQGANLPLKKSKIVPSTPEPEKKKDTNVDLGTITTNKPRHINDPFPLPLTKIKNTTKNVWAEMVIVSKDGTFVERLDDKDAVSYTHLTLPTIYSV